MTRDQHDEVHEISERLNRLLGWARWIAGGALTVGLGVSVFLLEIEGRVSSLEATQDSTSEAIERIDRNLEEISQYLRGAGR